MSAYITHLSPQELKYNFDQYDKDGSGSIQISELRDLFSRNGATLSDSALNFLWTKYDKNKDGKIDFPEFVEYVTGKRWEGPIPTAPHTWAHVAHLHERPTATTVEHTTTLVTQERQTATAVQSNAQPSLAFQQEFHRGFLEGYSQGYNQGLQKFLTQGGRPQAAPTQTPTQEAPQPRQTGQSPASPAPAQAPGLNWQQPVARHLQNVGTAPAPSNWQQPVVQQAPATQSTSPQAWQHPLARHIQNVGAAGQPSQPVSGGQPQLSQSSQSFQGSPQPASGGQPANWQQQVASHLKNVGAQGQRPELQAGVLNAAATESHVQPGQATPTPAPEDRSGQPSQ